VWTRTAEGTTKPVPVRLGITDGTYTEILEGDLQEGQDIIVQLAEEPGRAKQRPRLRF
jgi:HlyD family secretion protein